ncbi:MAG TPA: hypothetical protein VHS29_13380, partial [Candidatus Acidoferrales bacterium]|nr:hypothetical protein [Candidatus Acidoferrales bacterium]
HYAASGGAPIGRGFDKWWVFLSKAGASALPLWIIAGLLMAGALGSGFLLRHQYVQAITDETVSSYRPSDQGI